MRRRFVVAVIAAIVVSIAVLTANFAHADGFGRVYGEPYYTGTATYPSAHYVHTATPDIPYDGISENFVTVPMTVDIFVLEMRKRLNSSYSINSSRTAAIMNMMMGIPGDSPLYDGPSTNRWENGVAYARDPVRFAAWEDRIRQYDALGMVEWNTFYVSDATDDWMGTLITPEPPGGYTYAWTEGTPDLVQYFLNEESNDEAIVFNNPDGTKFQILKKCTNLVGQMSPLVPPEEVEFIPTVSADRTVVAPGEQVTFNFNIRNETSTPGVAQFSKRIDPDTGPRLHDQNGVTPAIAAGGMYSFPSVTVTATSSMGDEICGTLEVENPDDDAEVEFCVSIGKKPLFQITNGDIWAGGSFGSGATCSLDPDSPGNIRGVGSAAGGSWGEYGVFALGKVQGFGSAGQAMYEGQAASQLMFANTNPTEPGYFWGGPPSGSSGKCLTDVSAMFASGTLNPLPNNSGNLISYPNGKYQSSGDMTVRAPNTLGAGKRIVIKVNGTLRIDANGSQRGIAYDNGPYASIGEIPQVILIAENIIIEESVERIDAWLFASERIVTCDIEGSLDTNDCDRQLVFNGPVVSNQISLRRTAGTGNQPAERFNLRPEVYLRALADRTTGNTIRSVYQQELPPRY